MRIRVCCTRATNTGCCCRWRCSTHCRDGWTSPPAIVGFDDAIRARVGETVDVMAPNIRARLDPLLAAGLPADERARLVTEGAALRDDEAFRLAFGDPA